MNSPELASSKNTPSTSSVKPSPERATVKLSLDVKTKLDAFAYENNFTASESISVLQGFYETRCRHEFPIEAAEILSEIQVMERELLLVVGLIFELNDAVRRLVELREIRLVEAVKRELQKR